MIEKYEYCGKVTVTYDIVLRAIKTGKYSAKRLDNSWHLRYRFIRVINGTIKYGSSRPLLEYVPLSKDQLANDWVLIFKPKHKED